MCFIMALWFTLFVSGGDCEITMVLSNVVSQCLSVMTTVGGTIPGCQLSFGVMLVICDVIVVFLGITLTSHC